MRIKVAPVVLFLIVFVIGMGSVLSDMGPAVTGSQLHLVEVGDDAVVLELTVEDFHIERVDVGGQTYHRVLIDDASYLQKPGFPDVPMRGALLGIPSTQGVSVQVIDVDYEERSGYRIAPAAGIEVDVATPDELSKDDIRQTILEDSTAFSGDAFFPAAAAEIGYTGYMRDQAVAQVLFSPVQYHPLAHRLRLYHRILVRVTWDPPSIPLVSSRRGTSPAYERVLEKALLNYDALERGHWEPPASAEQTDIVSEIAAINADPELKIGVTEDGLYELTYDDLASAGLVLSGIDPRTFKLSNRGAEVPIYVNGEADGVFDSGDTVLFYGTVITDVYTFENVYWLSFGGADGLRMSTRDGTPGSGTVPDMFPSTLHAEEDTNYWITMPAGIGQDHWFWGSELTAPTVQTYTVTLDNIATSAPTATLQVRLKGRTDVYIVYPDHHTKIYLNGVLVDDQLWDGHAVFDHKVSVPHSLLEEGTNEIAIETVGDTGASIDQIYVNWLEIAYWDTFVAEGGELLFSAPSIGTHRFQVADFETADVQTYDVTDPQAVARLTNCDVQASGDGYMLEFEDTADVTTRYLALTQAQHKVPASIEIDQPSSWRSPSNGADYIIITHEDFYTNSLTLADHRSNVSGLRVATVKVGDLYDEFNYGVFNPQAIRSFLAYAYANWNPPAPTYVLLVGGSSYDYRDILHIPRTLYVPSQVIETALLGQTPSDNWFAQIVGNDAMPDLFIGRLPAHSEAQVDLMVDKIIHYDLNPPSEDWSTNVLLVADDDEPSFEAISEQLAARVPYYYTVDKVYAADYPPEDPTVDISDAINSGRVLVNYAGHGNVDMWGVWQGGHMFDASDVRALDNINKLPVVSVANCLNGYFVGSHVSLAEEFMRLQNKGAVATWAPTGLGFPFAHRELVREFYEAIFADDIYDLGAATTAAKAVIYAQGGSLWDELIQTFVLFGDPATQLVIPTNYPYLTSTTPADGVSQVPIDEEIQVVFGKPMLTSTVTLGGTGTAGMPFTATWNTDNTVVNYAHPDFAHGTTLAFTISGEDRLGNALGAGIVPAEWSFTVTDDDTAPGGTIGVEGGTLTDVPLDASVIVTFTEPMRTDSVVFDADPHIEGSVSWDAGQEVATFNHDGFAVDTTYTVAVTAAKDVAGNALAEPLDLTFHTTTQYLIFLPMTVRNN
jgi:hypothetical protein